MLSLYSECIVGQFVFYVYLANAKYSTTGFCKSFVWNRNTGQSESTGHKDKGQKLNGTTRLYVSLRITALNLMFMLIVPTAYQDVRLCLWVIYFVIFALRKYTRPRVDFALHNYV